MRFIKYYCGIDGGGTKTLCVIVNEDLELVHKKEYPGTNFNQIGEDKAISILEQLLEDISRYKIKSLTLGMPGYEEGSFIEERLCELFRRDNIYSFNLFNDVHVAMFGSLGLNDGIHVIAGTGSIACLKQDNEYKFCGGYGHLLEDPGSAFWIGLNSLKVVANQIDNNEDSKLSIAIKEQVNIVNREDLINFLYYQDDYRLHVASLAQIVDQCAKNGCKTSIKILKVAAKLLYNHVFILHKDKEEDLLVSFSGSVFKSKILKEEFYDLTSKENVQVIEKYLEPVMGAILYSINETDECNTKEIIKKLSEVKC
ncbi:MAG: BadF/BadG/BcrA/BcrD ATPase family protein [Mycoplasmatales bacterium]